VLASELAGRAAIRAAAAAAIRGWERGLEPTDGAMPMKPAGVLYSLVMSSSV